MSTDRREFFRCQVPASESPAILRTTRKDFVVTVHEESAGGFTVVCDKKPPVKVDQTVRLATGSGCCEAKVIHVTKADDGDQRIGLQRLREVKSLSNSLGSGSGAAFKLVAVIAMCFVFFTWGASQSSESTLWARATKLITGSEEDGNEPANDKPVRSREENEQKLVKQLAQLDHLKLPLYAQQLQLSRDQQDEISEIIRKATADLSSLYQRREELSPEDWTEIGLKLMHSSFGEIQGVMSDHQRSQWVSIMEQVQRGAVQGGLTPRG